MLFEFLLLLVESRSILALSTAVIYTTILVIFYLLVRGYYKEESAELQEAWSIVGSIKSYLNNEEEINLSKVLNEMTLTDLISQNPAEEQYEEVVDILADIAEQTYKEYKFLIVKSPDETKDAHFMQIQSSAEEMPTEHKLVFSKSMDYGLDMAVLRDRFSLRVAKGDVLDLGDEVMIILEDDTPQTPTGVSPVNSGLEGGEIVFNISFILKENYDAWAANKFPKTEVDKPE